MTEAEWLVSLDPIQVFQNLKGKPSWRKFRLFAVGCCRGFWSRLTDERSRSAVEAAEQYADKLISSVEAMNYEGPANEVLDISLEIGSDIQNDAAASAAICLALWATADWGAFQVVRYGRELLGDGAMVRLMDCVFRVPFRSVAFDPAWLTSTAVGIAQGIYDDRAFDRMPILADALQDAGCENADILGHCRGEGPHVRGCWVVDLVLGKE